MKRRNLIKSLALLALSKKEITKSFDAGSAGEENSFENLVSKIGSGTDSRPAFVMDGHIHVMSRQLLQGLDIGDRYSDGMVDLPRIKEGGINAFFFSVYTPEPYLDANFEVKNTFRVIELALEQIQKNNNIIELALNASDIVKITKKKKLAAFLDIEGSFDNQGDLYLLRALHRLGVRSLQLTAHNKTNSFIDACSGERIWPGGLNDKGIGIIKEMNRLGMLINVAHASSEAIIKAANVSDYPVAYTHGGFRGMVDIKRNISDEAALAIAKKGGIVSFQFGNYFNYPKYYKWASSKPHPVQLIVDPGRKFMTIEDADADVASDLPFVSHAVIPDEYHMSTDDFVKAVDYGVRLVGEDHIGFGSDFDGGLALAKEMKDASDYMEMFKALKRLGYSSKRIDKIMGLNWLRVIRQVTGG